MLIVILGDIPDLRWRQTKFALTKFGCSSHSCLIHRIRIVRIVVNPSSVAIHDLFIQRIVLLLLLGVVGGRGGFCLVSCCGRSSCCWFLNVRGFIIIVRVIIGLLLWITELAIKSWLIVSILHTTVGRIRELHQLLLHLCR